MCVCVGVCVRVCVLSSLGKLQIERAQESDMGKYECVATNSDGVAHSNGVQVYVKGALQ